MKVRIKSLFTSLPLLAVLFVFTQCGTKPPQETQEDTNLDSRIIETDTSKVCPAFTIADPDLRDISQQFADMNLRRQAGDYGPGEYTAHYYWEKMYEEAPGFSILVYTDGSAIFREMAAKAKADGDDEKYEEYVTKAFNLIEEGEKCYPETKGKFGPIKGYITELTEPGQYEKILNYYTEGLGPDTDPYSLGTIARYAKYAGLYTDIITKEEGDALFEKVRGYAAAKKGQRDYDYALEQINEIEKQYVELEAEKEAQDAEQQPSTTEEGGNAYNEMIAAANAGDLTKAHEQFKLYFAAEEDADRKYKTAMYIGGTHYTAEDYPKAREAYRMAMQADPEAGDPYYFIGLMYLSSGALCGPGTGFDSQRVIWAGFDKFKQAEAKTLTPANATDIKTQVSTYTQYLPNDTQLTEEGLAVGDSYTIPCWINESTTVRKTY